MRGSFLLVALVGSGCSDERLTLAWPEAIDLGFVVVMPEDWNGAPGELRIEGPVDLASMGRVELQAPLDARVFVVGIDEISARSVHPRVTELSAWTLTERSPELTAEPGCDAEGWIHADQVLELPLTTPEIGASIYEVDEGASGLEPIQDAPFAPATSLRASLRPCFDGRRLVVEPFADGTGDGVSLNSNYQVRFLEDDAILVLAYEGLTLMRKDDRFEDRLRLEPTGFGLPIATATSAWVFSASAFAGRSSSASGVIALSRVGPTPGLSFETRVYAVELTSAGFVAGPELWRQVAPSTGSPRSVLRLVHSAQGGWVGVGAGIVLTAGPGERAPRDFLRPLNFDATHLVATGLLASPFLLGGGSFLQWFNPALGENGFRDLPLDTRSGARQNLDALSVSKDPAGFGLLAAFSGPELARWSGASERWSHSLMWTNEDETRCVQRRYCGRAHASQRSELVLEGPVRPGSTTVVVPTVCARIYLIDEAASCAISAAFELGPAAGFGGPDSATIYDIDRRGEAMVMVGERGRVLALRLE